eukprot:8079609-Prorocentrum_lima.AAC.1
MAAETWDMPDSDAAAATNGGGLHQRTTGDTRAPDGKAMAATGRCLGEGGDANAYSASLPAPAPAA